MNDFANQDAGGAGAQAALDYGKLNQETAKIPWADLQRYFAAGRVLHVATALDLVEVASCVAQDHADRVRHWRDTRQLQPVSDAQARHWIEADAVVWAVVVKPWVLVQGARLRE